jgi:hypothetical protein
MIDRDGIAFLDSRRVAVSIASRSEHCIPSVTRALGYRISADTSEYTYSLALRKSAESDGLAALLETRIPRPGLAKPGSQLAAPMLVGGRTVGVLFVESPEDGRFHWEDEGALVAVASQLGMTIATLQQAAEAGDEPGAATSPESHDGHAKIRPCRRSPDPRSRPRRRSPPCRRHASPCAGWTRAPDGVRGAIGRSTRSRAGAAWTMARSAPCGPTSIAVVNSKRHDGSRAGRAE